jgi:hypothetical protein
VCRSRTCTSVPPAERANPRSSLAEQFSFLSFFFCSEPDQPISISTHCVSLLYLPIKRRYLYVISTSLLFGVWRNLMVRTFESHRSIRQLNQFLSCSARHSMVSIDHNREAIYQAPISRQCAHAGIKSLILQINNKNQSTLEIVALRVIEVMAQTPTRRYRSFRR